MVSSYEHFVAFGVDNGGLERLLRLFQSFFMILTSYPVLIAQLMPTHPVSVHMATETCLKQLQGTLNVTRRTFRLFRFLETFNASYALYLTETKTIETWLDVASKSALATFGMLESVTLPDLLGVDHLEFFGPAQTTKINVDAQIFWFIGLYTSAISTAIKLVRILAYSPVPQTGEGFGTGKDSKEKSGGSEKEESKEEKIENEKKLLKEAAEKRKEERKEWAKKVSKETSLLGQKFLADVLDLIIPASVMGWVQVHTGIIGIAMFTTSVLTGLDAWRRVGRDLERRQAA
ncbi:unnamed protein product [Clonostachys rhizophaga]|uniref:AoPex11B-like protein n=1 Tax=Clonostachys rhizophaga TaxID=160324 RepID=A0A9N9V3N6_9HYPO|nr:unnamed protein product [Clonostachys rhizophaga]